jgi:hypothetical protein
MPQHTRTGSVSTRSSRPGPGKRDSVKSPRIGDCGVMLAELAGASRHRRRQAGQPDQRRTARFGGVAQ